MAYIGNDDFRGYLAARASGPGGLDPNAKAALGAEVGNDGGYDSNRLNSYYDSPTENRAAERDALVGWTTNEYQKWLQRDDGSTGVLGSSTYSSGGSGGSDSNTEATALAQRKTEIQRQIEQLNSMLGVTGAQKDPGLQGIDNKFNESKTRLGEQRLKVNTGYDDQNTQALAGRTRGYEQVDNYANKSANSLSRIFQGANAGNSSVARLLAPQLVGKASDSRRLDVTETANQNLGGIKKARDEADTEFNYADQELENNRGYEKEAFEKGIVQDEFEKYNQKLALEQEDGRDFSDTQNKLSERTQRLSQLFGAGKFNPQYQVRSVAPQAVALNDYKVDPMALKLGQQQQGGSFYAPQLKKKQELRVR